MKKGVFLLVLCVLFCTSCSSKAKDKKTDTTSSNIILTTQFLEGIWVNESGFVCEYSNGIFTDMDGVTYEECQLNETGIEGKRSGTSESTSFIIKVTGEDSIQVNSIQAYQVMSETAQKYMKQLKKNVLGKWEYIDPDMAFSVEINEHEMCFGNVTKGKLSEKESTIPYDLRDSKVIAQGADTSGCLYVTKDTLRLSFRGLTNYFFRHGSKAYEIYARLNQLSGKWIMMSEDMAVLEDWYFQPVGKLVIQTNKAQNTVNVVPRKLIPVGRYYQLMVGTTVYDMQYLEDRIILKNDNKCYYFVPSDSECGKNLLEIVQKTSKQE